MNRTNHLIKPAQLLIVLLTLLMGLSGCATLNRQKSADINKKELAMRIQSSTSFINAAVQQAKSSDSENAQQILNNAHTLSFSAKNDFTRGRYKHAFDKVSEAYQLTLNALTILKNELPSTEMEAQQLLHKNAGLRLQVNEHYLNAVEQILEHISTELAKVDFDFAKSERDKALSNYNAAYYHEAINRANISTDKLMLILKKLEKTTHNKEEADINIDQLINKVKKEQEKLQSIQLE
ncbi:MAG: hypothetical protein L3J28_14555 [Candidatus Polarisedimenticolaceae bacterium]|nr:hypothetical protein [Candidatus Polarisedimenticolaceae bacterium]